MSNIDEAALKAGISEPVASELPLDVDGLFMHLKILGLDNERLCKQALRIAIASRSQPVAAEQAEDSAMLDWLDKNNARFQMGWRVGIAPAGNASIQSVIQLGGQPLTSIRAAIRAAMSNREAGNANQG